MEGGYSRGHYALAAMAVDHEILKGGGGRGGFLPERKGTGVRWTVFSLREVGNYRFLYGGGVIVVAL